MKYIALLMSLSCFSASSLAAAEQVSDADKSARVSVSWQSPEDYRDIRPAQELKSAYHRRTFANFERIFTNLAEQLPDGFRWEVTVTDVDLAGEVRPTQGMGGGMIRIIRPIFFPQISLTYKVFSADNAVVLEDQAQIKDMNFNQRIRNVRMNEPLFYEKQMLSLWFKRKVLSKL